jgi:MFS transporter, NNP family, nitrate/nitrite transporter
LGGWLSDRIGGARVTLWCFLGMGLCTGLAITGVRAHSFPVFFGAYMIIFLLSGAGNGSTYRMIPVIFGELGRREIAEEGGDPAAVTLAYKRKAAAVIGIAGAIGAFGGFLIQVVFRQASVGVTAKVTAADTLAEKVAVAQANDDWSTSALWVFLAAYAVFATMTWFYYLRRSFVVARVPSLAHAGV